MNSSDLRPAQQGVGRQQHGYASFDANSRQTSSSAGRKRASRAGTRSVTTLSAAQLERKRANDREAQRAIRQRIKDHSNNLERNIIDLRAAQNASEKMVVITQQRNRKLEEENAYLRTELGEARYPITILAARHHQLPDHGLDPVHTTSSILRPGLTSTPQRTLLLDTPQSANSRHGSWQQKPSSFNTFAPPVNLKRSTTSSIQLAPNLLAWKSHQSSPSVHSSAGQMQAPAQTSYTTVNPNERTQWSRTAQVYNHPNQKRPQQFEPPAQLRQYAQPPVQTYAPKPQPQQVWYHAPPHSLQAEFQGMAVSSPNSHPVLHRPGSLQWS